MQVFDSGKIYDFMGKKLGSFVTSCIIIFGSIFFFFIFELN